MQHNGNMLVSLVAMISTSVTFYIGTYTSKDGSKGIYRSQLDLKSGALSEPILVAEAPSPSFVALHPNGKTLYAALESTNGDVAAYSIDENGGLKLLNKMNGKGANPCHISVDAARKFVFVANYTGGNAASFPILADGSLGNLTGNFQNSGSGPDKSRQEKPHMHAIYPDSKRSVAFACDLGTDSVLALDSTGGLLAPISSLNGKVTSGGGPRHLAIHPKLPFLYVNNELNATISVMKIDEKNRSMLEAQVISTLPADSVGIRKSTAEIRLHPNNNFLYVSNRGHDSIAGYKIQKDGKLILIGIFSVGVKEPRGFDIDPSGKFIVVGGQNSESIGILTINSKTGALDLQKQTIKISKPVCIVFAK
jgi:6-phosphogluconolactonase